MKRSLLVSLMLALALSLPWASVIASDRSGSKSGSVSMGDVEIVWQRDGEGSPIFVVGSTVYYPRAFSDRLRRRFELVFIDGRHFMPEYSPARERLESIDLSTFAQDVERVREVLDYERIIVLGHSIHGQIALEYAHRYSNRVAGIVLIGAVPFAFEEFAEEVAVAGGSFRRAQEADGDTSRHTCCGAGGCPCPEELCSGV